MQVQWEAHHAQRETCVITAPSGIKAIQRITAICINATNASCMLPPRQVIALRFPHRAGTYVHNNSADCKACPPKPHESRVTSHNPRHDDKRLPINFAHGKANLGNELAA